MVRELNEDSMKYFSKVDAGVKDEYSGDDLETNRQLNLALKKVLEIQRSGQSVTCVLGSNPTPSMV